MIKLLDTVQDLELYSLEDSSPRDAAQFFAGERAEQPLEALVAIVTEASANRVIVERDYIDFIYRDEYASFYAGIFSNYGPYCTRLTFFSSLENSLLDLLDGSESLCVGFSVLRPTLVGRVGRSIISPPTISEPNWLPCLGNYEVHLLGRQFDLKAFPFMQQDGQVMRCAQVSMLMCMLYLQRSQSESLSLPHEISEVATRDFVQLGRPFPSAGLLPSEINHFLWRVGYGPVRYDSRVLDEHGFDKFVFVPYLLSRIPALLMSDDHSVVAIGFTMQFEAELNGPIGKIQDFIGNVIVHNDGVGPYTSMPIDGNSPDSSLRPSHLQLSDIRSIVIPCPRKMYMRAAHAEELAVRFLRDAEVRMSIVARAAEGCATAKVANEIFSGRNTTDQIITRPVLMTSQELKEKALKKKEFLDPRVCAAICNVKLPRIIWVIELATLSSMKSGKWEAIGEVVIDATGHFAAAPELIVHMPGTLMTGTSRAPVDVTDSAPYRSWLLNDDEL